MNGLFLEYHTWRRMQCFLSTQLPYRSYIAETSCYRQTESQNVFFYRLVSLLSSPNPLKPSVKSRMKMQLEQRRQAVLQLHLSDQQLPTQVRLILVGVWYIEMTR